MTGAGRVYEWDERKRSINLRKHGLDFADCACVFAGPTITSLDDRYSDPEARYSTLGLFRGRVVQVAHTEQEDGLVRIISFRKAKKREQACYFEAFQNGLEARRRYAG